MGQCATTNDKQALESLVLYQPSARSAITKHLNGILSWGHPSQ
ncbi:UNVERIFIED_ORG: hypothetical protein ABIC72_002662 [Burkholderia sp. 1988]|nr:hypothetical protein [Paraburkholderia terricola]